MITRALITALLLCTAVACKPPAADSAGESLFADTTPASNPSAPMTGDVQLTLDRASYAAGAQVTLTIRNRTPRELGYNACTRVVERESGGRWSQVPEPDRMCTMELRLLAGGATVNEGTELPDVLAAGRYRLTLAMHDESSSSGEPLTAASRPFDVR